MRNLLMGLVLVMSGCCAYPGEVYITADESTYKWAAPKLREWAEAKNDPEWTEAVDAKLISWEARYKKGKTEGKSE